MGKTEKPKRFGRIIQIAGIRLDLMRFLPFMVCLVTAVVSLTMIVNYLVESNQRKSENRALTEEYSQAFVQDAATQPPAEAAATPEPVQTPVPQLRETYRTMRGEVSEKAMALFEQNGDLVGWLHIKNVVDLPVVYRDNEYYLTHGFNGKKNKGGALFLDENHPMAERTQHLVIHGHNMNDSSMFGIVSRYDELKNVKRYAFARFSTLYAPEDYVICAVLRVNPDPDSKGYFSYVGRDTFSSAEEFFAYTQEMQERSLFDIPIDLLPSDALLTLSTCVEDDRLAVVFRSVREGETQEQLQALVDQATKK